MFSRLLTVVSTILAVSTVSVSAAFADCRINPTDPAITKKLAGYWYSETYQSSLGYTSKTITEFLPTGVWSYQQQTCGTLSGYTTCSNAQGHGLWMANRQSNSIFITLKFLDDTSGRKNICPGRYYRFQNANTLIDQYGTRYSRRR
jgi:hypothetical protein